MRLGLSVGFLKNVWLTFFSSYRILKICFSLSRNIQKVAWSGLLSLGALVSAKSKAKLNFLLS